MNVSKSNSIESDWFSQLCQNQEAKLWGRKLGLVDTTILAWITMSSPAKTDFVRHIMFKKSEREARVEDQ
jgi:hypothetical protein